jgi:PAS domain-containing protein/DNA-binding XRE family transcriptional regulator
MAEYYADKVMKIISQKGMKKSYIYKTVGVTKQTFWNWENGKSVPDYEKMKKISEVLQVNINEISNIKKIKNNIDNKNTLIPFYMSSNGFSLAKSNQRSQAQQTVQNNIEKLFKELNYSSIVTETLFNYLDVLFYIKNRDLKYIGANNAFLKTMGIKEYKSILNLDDKNVMLKVEAVQNNNEDKEVLESINAIKYEGYIPNTRKSKWGIITKAPIVSADRDVIGLVATFTDITERKRAENRARIFENTMNCLPVSIWIKEQKKNGKHRFLYISKDTEKLTGYTVEHIRRNPLFSENSDFWYSIPKKKYDELLKTRQLNAGKVEHVEEFTAIRNFDRKEICLRKGIYTSDNVTIEIIRNISNEVSETKLYKMFSEFYDGLKEIYIIFDTETLKVIFANNVIENICNLPGESCRGVELDNLLKKIICKENMSVIEKIINKYKLNTLNEFFRINLYSRKGKSICCRGYFTEKTVEGKYVGILCINPL